MSKDKIMTTRQLAEYIKLNEKTVIKMAQKGRLPGVKIGSQWRFPLAAIDNYLQGQIVKSLDEDLDLVIQTETDIIPLSRLISPELIDLNLNIENSNDALVSLVKIAKDNQLTKNDQLLLKELKEREKMMSTGIGNAIAIPHPRNPSVKLFNKPNIIFARSLKAVDFSAPDKKGVSIFFMVCAPNEFVHLRILAKIAKLLNVKGTISKLFLAQDSKQLMQVFLEFERRDMFLNHEKV
ncbi:MAG: PTS sugar transporter subunit IIA [Candidatus Omnitrophota bacterium]